MSKYALIIDGKRVETPATFRVQNPFDESLVADSPQGTVELLDKAVAAARKALPGWSALSQDARAAKLMEIADLIEKNHKELAELITLEQGKPQSGMGANMEVGGAAVWTRVTAGLRIPEETIQDDDKGK
ncbi:MAG: aldehyde dehydrogenase family protein, partial [Proteobacteria bacterium]|nr:aldehyde dehydrogenase family protein [Pseudomonadota bacterium]